MKFKLHQKQQPSEWRRHFFGKILYLLWERSYLYHCFLYRRSHQHVDKHMNSSNSYFTGSLFENCPSHKYLWGFSWYVSDVHEAFAPRVLPLKAPFDSTTLTGMTMNHQIPPRPCVPGGRMYSCQ
jgi:hypothetical protein